MKQKDNSFQQTNSFAMLYGLYLGLWGLLGLTCVVQSFSHPSLSLISSPLMWSSPFLAAYLTYRFRRNVMLPELGFSFGRGFLFTFFMGMYASLWIAIGTFVYMAYFDNGAIFNAYEAMLSAPEVTAELRASGMWDMLQAQGGINGFVDVLRGITPAAYAGSILYITLLTAPVISAIIALIFRKSGNGWIMPSSSQK